MKSQTVSLLVRNEPGLLARISVLIARFGYNINKLSVEKYKQSNIALILIEFVLKKKN